jgi:hypothetical protein
VRRYKRGVMIQGEFVVPWARLEHRNFQESCGLGLDNHTLCTTTFGYVTSWKGSRVVSHLNRDVKRDEEMVGLLISEKKLLSTID